MAAENFGEIEMVEGVDGAAFEDGVYVPLHLC